MKLCMIDKKCIEWNWITNECDNKIKFRCLLFLRKNKQLWLQIKKEIEKELK